ncbi:MAG: Tn3 family transposase, partial [Gammaproteobacteria bacterium]|nr:Tn3 family transposase [Gammaproteobacteria bacterium]
MKRNWSDEELTEQWFLSVEELALLPNRVEHNRFGFAIQLKFFEIEGRFPRSPREIPAAALRCLANQLGLSINIFQKYDWRGRARKDHRAAIREYLGFRPFTATDGAKLDDWLWQEVVSFDQNEHRLTEAVLDWCRDHRIEPPSPKRIERQIRSLRYRHEAEFFAAIADKLPGETRARLDALLQPSERAETAAGGGDEESAGVATPFSQLKTDPGPVGLNSVLKELIKLEQLTVLDLPADLFAGVPPKFIHGYCLRAATEPPREMRLHPAPIRYTLLAAFCWQRRQEVIDGLVELLIRIVHRIGVRAEKKIVKKLLSDFQRIHGKTTLLFKIAEVALDNPEGTIKDVLYPIVSEKTLEALVKEYRSQGPAYRQHVHTLIRSSYSHHYRRMLPLILEALTFRSNNSAHQPVIDALAWLQAHRDDRYQFVACDEVPIDGVIRPQMQDILLEEGPDGTQRINRINYEIAVLQALRERLRCKESWVEGADRYRNPDDDLPADFDHQRAVYYDALQLPQDPDKFIASVQQAMTEALTEFDQGLPHNPKVKLRSYGKNRIVLTPSDPQPEPDQLSRLKAEVLRRWPMTSLLDVLKEADLRIGFTDTFQTLASREILDRDTLRPRLLRCLYGLGTNTGLKRMITTDEGINYT